jgi:uncharacterized protein YdiU (UPF0061 family)
MQFDESQRSDMSSALFRFDNSYAEQLPGFHVPYVPPQAPQPTLLKWNDALAEELGMRDVADAQQLARIFSGSEIPDGATPVAQAYAGHQFGHFVPQLGDGRAVLLGEVVDRHGRRRDIALKGSGATPFARGGDGKAAIGPVLREYLMGEAMHALGVPTTRALAAVATGELVRRERPLPGAVLTRVAASHVRVGTFEFFARQGRYDYVQKLADYVIARHDPSLVDQPDRYRLLLEAVTGRQAELIARWMLLGFIHGVMNTDNMAISGETIDYGPCAFMEAYNPRTVFSSIDTMGRYAYANQPLIAPWNLARFAETLVPLIDSDSPERAVEIATAILRDFMPRYEVARLAGSRLKLGLTHSEPSDDEEDRRLSDDWFRLLEEHEVDFTLGWRSLADVLEGDMTSLTRLFTSLDPVQGWLDRWQQRVTRQSADLTDVARTMRAANPLYIPRNHLVEEALSAATSEGDLSYFEQLLQVITRPYEHQPDQDRYAQPAPRSFTACYKTFCGT